MNICNYFNEEIKRNILSEKEYNGEHSILSRVDWRNIKEAYKEHYTPEQLQYLFAHNLLREYVKTGAVWERPYSEYWEFTDKGKSLRKWYNRESLWKYFYYKSQIYMLKYYWQKFRIKCGHRYPWQEYEGVDISEI